MADERVESGEFEDVTAVNSEVRFLTLELMKLAVRERKSFDDVTRAFVGNAFKLHRVLTESRPSRARRARR